MAWKIEISATAEKQLAKFDKHVAKRIYRYLTDYISKLDDPRSVGEPLTGSQLGNFGDIEQETIGLFAISKISNSPCLLSDLDIVQKFTNNICSPSSRKL